MENSWLGNCSCEKKSEGFSSTPMAVKQWNTVAPGGGEFSITEDNQAVHMMNQGVLCHPRTRASSHFCRRDLSLSRCYFFVGLVPQPSSWPFCFGFLLRNIVGPSHRLPSIHSSLLPQSQIPNLVEESTLFPCSSGCSFIDEACHGGPILLISDWFTSGHLTQLWPMR